MPKIEKTRILNRPYVVIDRYKAKTFFATYRAALAYFLTL